MDRLTRLQVQNQRSSRSHHGGHLEALQQEAHHHKHPPGCHGDQLLRPHRGGGVYLSGEEDGLAGAGTRPGRKQEGPTWSLRQD